MDEVGVPPSAHPLFSQMTKGRQSLCKATDALSFLPSYELRARCVTFTSIHVYSEQFRS